MAGHTPGPWWVSHDDIRRFKIKSHRGVVASTSIGPMSTMADEGLVNARLIAAAPCQNTAAVEIDRLTLVILSAVKADQSEQYDAVVAALLANRAAIAKATGEAL